MPPTSARGTARPCSIPVLAAAAVFLQLSCACVGAPGTGPGPVPGPPITATAAKAVLDAQVACWNQGDLPGFVATYWDGPELTFFGSSGLTRGRQDLLATYQRAYPTARERGVLSFTVVDFQALGDAHALLLGSYHLEREQPADGVFSLVLARQGDRIVILHDHSAAAAPPKPR